MDPEVEMQHHTKARSRPLIETKRTRVSDTQNNPTSIWANTPIISSALASTCAAQAGKGPAQEYQNRERGATKHGRGLRVRYDFAAVHALTATDTSGEPSTPL